MYWQIHQVFLSIYRKHKTQIPIIVTTCRHHQVLQCGGRSTKFLPIGKKVQAHKYQIHHLSPWSVTAMQWRQIFHRISNAVCLFHICVWFFHIELKWKHHRDYQLWGFKLKDFRIPMARKNEKMLGNDVFFKIETEMSGKHFFLKLPQLHLSGRSKNKMIQPRCPSRRTSYKSKLARWKLTK